ncbi:hypothetical protein NL676_038024 [Syzygium grande]|nr:hypothetical protein NL676_038024 [Syzygium grande]
MAVGPGVVVHEGERGAEAERQIEGLGNVSFRIDCDFTTNSTDAFNTTWLSDCFSIGGSSSMVTSLIDFSSAALDPARVTLAYGQRGSQRPADPRLWLVADHAEYLPQLDSYLPSIIAVNAQFIKGDRWVMASFWPHVLAASSGCGDGGADARGGGMADVPGVCPRPE